MFLKLHFAIVIAHCSTWSFSGVSITFPQAENNRQTRRD